VNRNRILMLMGLLFMAASGCMREYDDLRIIAVRNASAIWIMNADGSNPVRITQKGGASPAWSPDGKWIAFERDEQIWLVSPDGQKEVHLKTDFPVGCPSWSPDSRKIVFDGVKDFEYDADLYVMTIKY